MVRFGCPKHQKVHQGHKKVPCEFRTQPQPTRKFAQLSQPSSNEKWKPLTPHQLPKNQKMFFCLNAAIFFFLLNSNFQSNQMLTHLAAV